MKIRIGPLGRGIWQRATTPRGQIATRSGIASAARSQSGLLIDAVDREADVAAVVRGFSGSFAVIVEDAETVFAAVDAVRSIPLFYAVTGGVVYINDEPQWILDQLPECGPDTASASEFALTGFVTGEETLFADVSQLEAGTALHVGRRGDSTPTITRHHRWNPRYAAAPSPTPKGLKEVEERLDTAVDVVVERLMSHADGQQIVIPLSGGFDSRLIAASLTSKGYDNLLAFTYGRPDSTESTISREIAAALRISWVKVRYDAPLWKKWYASPERHDYFRQSHLGTSLPHIQDWPAIWDLRNQGAVSDQAVFVPGHSGDFVAGSHILSQFASPGESDSSRLVEALAKKHYSLWPTEYAYSSGDSLQSRIESRLGPLPVMADNRELLDAADAFNHRERQSKFIVNSVRAYEFWGYQWWLPLWDVEFLDVWAHVPLQLRLGTRLYTDFVARKYASVAGLPPADGYRRDGADGRWSTLLSRSKKALPAPARRALISALRRSPGGRYTSAHPMGYFGWLDDSFVRAYPRASNINSFVVISLLDELGILDSIDGTRSLPDLKFSTS